VITLADAGYDVRVFRRSLVVISAAALMSTAVIGQPASAAAKVSCTYADRYISYPSTTHATAVKWAVRVDWCYDGKTVSNIRHYDYLKEDGGGVADYQGLIQNQLTYPGSVHYEATLVKQAKIALCVFKIGCYRTYYPFEKFVLGNNGSYRIEQKK
jgi:hypothetical protein